MADFGVCTGLQGPAPLAGTGPILKAFLALYVIEAGPVQPGCASLTDGSVFFLPLRSNNINSVFPDSNAGLPGVAWPPRAGSAGGRTSSSIMSSTLWLFSAVVMLDGRRSCALNIRHSLTCTQVSTTIVAMCDACKTAVMDQGLDEHRASRV